MNKKILISLEFNKVVDMLSDCINTTLGKNLAHKLEIQTDFDEVLKLQEETSEAQKLLLEGTNVPVSGLHDVSSMLKLAKIGSSMDLASLIHTAKNLNIARVVFDKLKEREELPILLNKTKNLYLNYDLENKIYSSILSDNEISDDASVELRRIRREIVNSKEKVKAKLEQIISSATTAKYLQDQIVTMRQDRYVVPVKAEYRSSIPGIVHDTSSSGATVFIEPMSVVDLNNNLRILFNKERDEIERIVLELSNEAGEYCEEILNNQEILAEIDFILGKGQLSVKLKAIEPKINRNKLITLKNARHPLIDPEKIVPLNFKVGDKYSTLVITGPNTGGKTVTLKTVGLLTLMLQAGLHIPCDYGTSMYVFDNVFADIGDDQSISQNLSTFSSHMKNIVEILRNATNKSLVILDELGSGTDPDEGSALAIAILEHLKSRKITTIATTHYSNLKAYALNTPFVENASVEFDIETLSPTYKLLIGIPGKSNAFNISKKIGLDRSIVDDASKFLNEDTIKMEDILIKIDKDRREIEKEKEKISLTSENIQGRLTNLERREKKLEDSKEKIIKEAKKEAQKIIKEAQSESDAILKKLRTMEKKAAFNSKEAEALQKDMSLLRDKSATKENLIRINETIDNLPPDQIVPGEQVFVDSFQRNATIVNVDYKKSQAVVQMDNLKINVPFSALSQKRITPTSVQKDIGKIHRKKALKIKSEVDVRGMDAEEALEVLTKYLDDAFLANMQMVTIIHGVGTGVLSKTVDNLLKTLNYVKEYRLGTYGEGGQGITIVKFK